MKKSQYDAMIKATNWLESARGSVENAVEIAEVAVTETAANLLQMIDSVQSKIDETLMADPVEDVVNKPGKTLIDSLLDNIVKNSQPKNKPFDWASFTDSPRQAPKAEDPSDVVKNISDDVKNVSREDKIVLIREHLSEWKNETFAASRSEAQVDSAYLGVRLGLAITEKFKRGN